MKLKNVTSDPIEVWGMTRRIPGQRFALRLIIQPDEEVSVFDEEAEKSQELANLLDSGKLTVVGAEEPILSPAVEDPSSALVDWALANDHYIQFAPVAGGDNAYSGEVGTPTPVTIWVTSATGVRDTVNSLTTVRVSVIGGTAPSPTLNGLPSPVTVTVAKGAVQVLVDAADEGTVLLGLSNATHPSVTLDATDTATVNLTAALS